MTYHTPDLSEARREMFRRANRWGGPWVVVHHPHFPGEYGVGMRNIIPGKEVASTDGGTLNEALSPQGTPAQRGEEV